MKGGISVCKRIHLSTSMFVLGPNENLSNKLYKLKRDVEILNPNDDVDIEIVSKTSEDCAVGCTIYHYSVFVTPKLED
jgi:hypothetical protein